MINENVSDKRLLIINNIVLSKTTNTGKTIYSFFDSLPPENVQQIYFSGETPAIEGYKYYRIYDKDIIRGKFNKNNRGGIIEPASGEVKTYDWYGKESHNHSDFVRLMREILWFGSWESSKLWEFLDEFCPTSIFFVGGDFCAAYRIARKIKDRYQAKFCLYITDDYVFPRSSDNVWAKVRRYFIRKNLKKTLAMTDEFFTISPTMQEAYKEELGRESHIIVNMPEEIKKIHKTINNEIVLIYAGSIGLGRAQILSALSIAIDSYNKSSICKKKAVLKIYSNTNEQILRKQINPLGTSTYLGGQLNEKELTQELLKADIPVFVESFNQKNIEITKFSLSTKVPEYLALKKPILAIGPSTIGSMVYLDGVAFCITDESKIEQKLFELLNSNEKGQYANKAYAKYEVYNKKNIVQAQLISRVL